MMPDHSPTFVATTTVTARATKTRWLILLLIGIMYMITYMDRTGISIAAPSIAHEFGFSQTAIGIVFSVFLWAYALGQVPAGWFADRFGPRLTLLILVPLWSVMTAMTSVATGILSLIIVRFIFGLAEAGAFPAATRGMQLWFPSSERGIVHGVSHSFSRFAVAIVPFIAVSIIAALGWRWIFYLFGAIGLFWSFAFFWLYRDLPEKHPGVNRLELAYIRECSFDGVAPLPRVAQKRPEEPWKKIFGSRNMWYIAVSYGCFYYGTYFYVTWFPDYLLQYRHVSLKTMGTLAPLPLVAGMVGDLLGGSLTDGIYRKTGRLKFARRVVAAPSMMASGLCLIPAALTHDAMTAIFCLAVSLFFLELVISPAWAVPMDVGGRFSGTVSGLMNMTGALVASVSPIIFGYLVQRGQWITPFFISAGVLLTGSIFWAFLIDPEKSVVGDALI
jgi:sugar phosphate permease